MFGTLVLLNTAGCSEAQLAYRAVKGVELAVAEIPKSNNSKGSANSSVKRLASEGNAVAQFKMGAKYEYGQRLLKNYDEAIKWYQLSAAQGYLPAQVGFNRLVSQGKVSARSLIKISMPPSIKISMPPSSDLQNAIRAYEQEKYPIAFKKFVPLAENGDATAQYYLGRMYTSGGVGVKKDFEKAFGWFELAANQGHKKAGRELANSYEYGRGTPKNIKKADKWYTSLGASKAQIEETLATTQTAQPKPTITANTEPQPKSIITPAKAIDTTPPSIDIAAAITVKTDSPTVHGRVSDKNRIARITVDGVAADYSNGNFRFKRYVPPEGVSLRIEAIDEMGNKSSRTVELVRAVVDTSNQITFSSLDPTKIVGRVNKDALALVIGVADYTRAPKAAYADSDASVFSDYAHRALGIPRSRIKVLTNGSASRTDLQIAIKQWLRGRIEEGKTDVYVFYAGHGLASPDGEDLYLLPYNGAPSLLDETSLKRTELFDVIADANPRSATVFLDTCYSGLSRGQETLLASARPILIAPKQQTVPKGFTVFSAESGQQISSGLDEAKHGLFSYYLMKGMEGPADANSDRQITVGELHAYVRKNVKQQAIRLGREQTPELQGDADRVLVRW